MSAKVKNFEPKILGFLCNWCSYAGADLAGVSRFQYPPNLRVVKVMCSTRVDPVFIIEGFLKKIDGIAVLGCHLGDCHYISGNFHTQRKIKLTKKILSRVGVVAERLMLDWVSAAEGEKFARLIKEFTEKIKEIGPFGEKESISPPELETRLQAAKQALQSEKLRWLIGKERELTEEENVYHEKISIEDYDRLMEENIELEYELARICLSLTETSKSVRDLAAEMALPSDRILQHISYLEHSGVVTLAGEENRIPKYRKI
jgi:coenzyme F420-reducing hydrogenase delta subunit